MNKKIREPDELKKDLDLILYELHENNVANIVQMIESTHEVEKQYENLYKKWVQLYTWKQTLDKTKSRDKYRVMFVELLDDYHGIKFFVKREREYFDINKALEDMNDKFDLNFKILKYEFTGPNIDVKKIIDDIGKIIKIASDYYDQFFKNEVEKDEHDKKTNIFEDSKKLNELPYMREEEKQEIVNYFKVKYSDYFVVIYGFFNKTHKKIKKGWSY